MTDTTSSTELTSQYTAQVVGDLERNAKEQERVGAEIEALQEQLDALRRDQAVLTSLQQALGASGQVGAGDPAGSAVPRQKTAGGASRTARSARAAKPSRTTEAKRPRSRAGKPATAKGGTGAARGSAPRGAKAAAGGTAGKKAAATPASGQPTLVELIRGYLTEQGEPRSAAEVSAALGTTHPERRIKTNVVRTTLENLVARSHAHRTKQGTSVFYTATDGPGPATAPATAPSVEAPTA
ncbi:hypothetical protein ACGFS9_17910 [Streptomyces sp. NPDC048566]|uniref:hypothetical protein n=1 Tax=Streptomyces sp. NPDC048566 TaxID=3365569 RepID=UPI00371417A4